MSTQVPTHKHEYSGPQVTARSTEVFKSTQISSRKILENLSVNVMQYQQNLSEFYEYIEASVHKNGQIQCKCNNVLKTSLTALRTKFSQFANEWKSELPQICSEFMEIVHQICTLYQKQVQRLAQVNSKWEFSYHQLLKASGSTRSSFQQKNQVNSRPNESLNNSIISKDERQIKNQILNNKERQQTERPSSIKSMQIVRSNDQLLKIRETDFSMMREQITQLFEQDSEIYEDFVVKGRRESKVHCKILTEQEKNGQEVREFRLKTVNDELNIVNSASLGKCTQPRKNVSSFTAKSSQQNSRKNSIVMKDQFWSSLQSNILTANKSHASGKQNQMNVTAKERLSVASKQQEKTKMIQNSTGSKLYELKKNLYKSKNAFDCR